MGASTAEVGSAIGAYVLERKLGTGGMAEVYLARRTGPHGFTKRVALKRILPELSGEAEFVQMFCDEARVAATLSHPNIAHVIEFGEHEGELFIVMEYVDGVSCSAVLRASVQRGMAIPLGAALYIAREVLLALAFAHEATDEAERPLGIVHRDVSPSNVLVSRIGNVKLIDFGITRSLLAERKTNPGELKGKLRYMSPEQILGAEVDTRSDLFAAGIVLTEMIAGRALFGGRTDLEILTRISRGELGLVRDGGMPEDVAEVLEKALAYRPGARFQTAREFARALEDLASARSIRLDDTTIVPHLHAVGLLPSSSGTRPSAKAAGHGPPPLPGAGATVPEALERAPVEHVEPSVKSVRPSRRPGPPPPPSARPVSGAYRVRTRSGQIVGPLPRSEMLALIATGRLNARSSVSTKAESFTQAGTVPALSKLANHPAYRFRDDDATSPAWLERVDETSVPVALYRIAAERLTGLFLAVDGKRRKRVFFENGDPVLVASTDRDELLGRRLVASRLVSDKAIELALTRQPPLRLGEALVSFGVLGAAQLVRELSRQLEDRIVCLGNWRRGEIRFYPDLKLERAHQVRTREPTLELLTRMVREEYAPGDIAALLRPITTERLCRRAPADKLFSDLGLLPTESATLAFADGKATVRDVVANATLDGVTMSDALRAVLIGLLSGCLEAAGFRSESR